MGSMDNDNVEVVNLNISVGAGGVGSKPTDLERACSGRTKCIV